MLEIALIHTSKPGTNIRIQNIAGFKVSSQQPTHCQAGWYPAGSRETPPTPYSLYHRSHSLSLGEGQMAVFDNLLVINLPTHGLPFPSPSHITLCLGHALSLSSLGPFSFAYTLSPSLTLPSSLLHGQFQSAGHVQATTFSPCIRPLHAFGCSLSHSYNKTFSSTIFWSGHSVILYNTCL